MDKKEQPVPQEEATKRPVRKSIKLGTYLSVSELLKDLASSCGIDDRAKYMLESEHFSIAPESTEFEAGILTVAELGFPRGATLQEIYDKSLSLGYPLCPAEAGPQSCLQNSAQPDVVEEWVLVVMKAILGPEGDPNIFGIARDNIGHYRLCAAFGDPNHSYGPDRMLLLPWKE